MKTLSLFTLIWIFIATSVFGATHPIPDTGITKCYDDEKEIPCPKEGEDFYGQDGNYSINPMSYSKLDENGNDLPVTATEWAMVQDNVTGLIWENNSHESSWDNAQNVIAELNNTKFGGYSDWRLPTIMELGSIVDFSIPYPGLAINTDYFIVRDTFLSFYWSGSTYAGSIYYSLGVCFDDGHDDYSINDYGIYKYVRAVRGGQSVIGSLDNLIINGDGTVSDSATGLMWQQDTAKTADGGTTMVWKDALYYCDNLILGGHTDWRLPTIRELLSIVDYTVYSPAINISVFKDIFQSFYWSNSTRVGYIPNAWGVNFNYGRNYNTHKYYYNYVRAVRGGQASVIEPSDNEINSASISPSSVLLTQPGDEIRFLVKGYSSSGEITTPENILWLTSDSNVVSTEGGKVVAVGEGSATITASVGNITAQAQVTVNFTPVSIDVSPVLLFLEKGKSATPVVSATYSDGRRKEIAEYTLSPVSGGSNIRIDGGTIMAVADGISDIEVNAGFGNSELSASLRVNVTAPVPLNITPAAVRVKQSESVSIEIDGGTPPYSASASSPSGNAGTVERRSGQYIWTLAAPSEKGEYSYSILDSAGQKAVFDMTVLTSLEIQYQNATSAHRSVRSEPLTVPATRSGDQRNGMEEFKLKAVGGTPPFKWSSTAGEITVNPESPDDTALIIYRPPSASGIYTVSVVDSGGQQKDFKASTIVTLQTVPEKIYLSPDQSGDISIFGGVSPFVVSADAGVAGNLSYYPGVGIFLYTAPSTSGDYMITVKDSSGNTVRVYATVSPKLTVSPSKVYLHKNETRAFQIAGSVGNDEAIHLTALQGEVDNHPDNMQFSYTAFETAGSDVITITDLSGAQAKVEIEIVSSDTAGDFFITPSRSTILKNESRRFKSVGSIGQEIVWKALHGTISGQKQQSIEYTAPDIKQDTTTTTADTTHANHLNTQLYAADLENREAAADIYVIADKVLVSPSQVFLEPGESAEFKGVFGTEEYTFTWTDGDGSVDEASGILTYAAPLQAGSYYITVFDSAGNSNKAEVVVLDKASRTKIEKTTFFEITDPSPDPDSETQPVAVGSVQNGEKRFSLAFDFPNYKDGSGKSVPMNFYVTAFISDWNLWLFFDEHGNIFKLNNITPCMSRMTSAVYTEALKFDYCNPVSPLKVDMYVLAIESDYDPNNNMSFQPADAPFELWHYNFSFPQCQHIFFK